jgi:hypothetical protein
MPAKFVNPAGGADHRLAAEKLATSGRLARDNAGRNQPHGRHGRRS